MYLYETKQHVSLIKEQNQSKLPFSSHREGGKVLRAVGVMLVLCPLHTEKSCLSAQL